MCYYLEVFTNIIKVENNKIAKGSRVLIKQFISLVKLTCSVVFITPPPPPHVGLGFLAPFLSKQCVLNMDGVYILSEGKKMHSATCYFYCN